MDGSLQYLYDYDDEVEDPYLYSPGETYYSDGDNESNVEEYNYNGNDSGNSNYRRDSDVQFQGNTTNNSTYTWKIPTRNERKIEKLEKGEQEKIPFYSETTHRSQFVAFDPSVRRRKLSKNNAITPTSILPMQSETTYNNVYKGFDVQKRDKNINTCPAEKIIRQTNLLREVKFTSIFMKSVFQKCESKRRALLHSKY